MKHLLAICTCFALLAGCHFGEAVSLFDEDEGIERTVAALRQRIGERVLALNVSIAPDAVTIRAQNPSDRSHIDEWRLTRMRMASFNWERSSGPDPYELSLINPDLEANLFDLDEVDFAAAVKLARAAVERAALADKAKVIRMEIARQAFAPPRPASGEGRWTVDVRSDRESAQIFADARGTIVGVNLAGTNRAKTLDIFSKLDLVAEAARGFRFVLGPDRILAQLSVSPQTIGFETTLPDPSVPPQGSDSLKARKVYVWNINGLQRAVGKTSADAVPGKVLNGFSIDDIDWSSLPKIAAQATAELAMPQGRITSIELAKPASPTGAPILLWKVEVTDRNNETGVILADMTGAVRQVLPPQSRRQAIDWFDPKTMFDAIVRLGVEFGQDRQYAEITFRGDKVVITAQDHMQPGSYGQIVLTDAGLQRIGTVTVSATKNAPFRIGDLQALTVQQLTELEAKTLATLKLPPKSISSITISRGGMDPSPRGNATIEIKAEEKPSGRAGRVNYELDGTLIRAYLP